MEEIKVMEKPDWVSWDDIHELLLTAHKKNIAKGMVMNTTTMTGEEIKNYIGENGCCFIALCDGKLVGTTSMRISKGNRWYDRGKIVAKGTLSAVLKHYQGLGILEEMHDLRDKLLAKKKVQIIEGDTAEDNIIMRKVCAKNGFKEVRFFPALHQNHFSVYFVKWLGECPFSDRYIRLRFVISKFLTKIQYKKGKIERSKFLSVICKIANSIDARI